MAGEGFLDLGRRVGASQLVIAASEAVRFALLLAMTVLLGRALEPADFGFITLIPAIYLVTHVVLDLGTGALIARESVRNPERERPLLEAGLALRGIAGGVIGLAVAAFALCEPDPARRFWLCVTALTLPALAPAVLGAAFRIRQDQLPPALISIATIVLMLGLTLVGIDRGVDGTTFAAIYVLREVVNGVAIWVVGRVRHRLSLRPGFAGRDAGAFIRAAIPQNIAVVFQVASLNFGLFAVRALLGDTELGAYAAAWRLVNPVLLLMGALVAPLLPVLAQVARNRTSFRDVLSPAVGLGAGIGALGAGFLLAAGRDALRLLYDAPDAVKFSGGAFDAGPALMWLGFVFFAVSVGAVATTALLCADGERQLRAIAIVALLLNVATFFLLLPRLGRVAAAAGLLAAEVWTAVAALAILGRVTGSLRAPELVRSVLPALLLSGAMLLIPAVLAPATRVLVAAAIAAAGLVVLVGFGPGRHLRRSLGGLAP